MLEYAGLIALAVLVLGGLYATGVVERVGDRTGQAICRILNERDCATATKPATARRGGRNEDGPSPGLIPTPGDRHTGESTATPNPSPGPPVDGDTQKKAETERLLEKTPTGRAALQYARDHDVRVVYRPGGGDYFSEDENTIYMDSSKSPAEIAAFFAHEMNHARTNGYPPVDKMSRDDYIDKSIQEEAHGNVLQVKENQELQRVLGKDKVPDTLFQSEYETAYDGAVSAAEAQAAKQGRTLTPQQKQRIGEQAGEARMKKAIEDGEIVQSTDGKRYREHYGKQWDDAHKHDGCFLWVFC